MTVEASAAQRVDRVVEHALAPLDGLRVALLRSLAPWLGPLFADREGRAGLLAALGLTAGAVLIALFPLFFLRVGPVLLGVAHLLADGRYLVARAGLHRRPAVVALVFVPCALAWFHPSTRTAGLAVVGAALAARGPLGRRGVVAGAGLALALAGQLGGRVADVVFAHAHNLVAFVALVALYARTGRAHRAAVGAAALAVGLAVALPACVEPWLGPGVRVGLVAFGTDLAPSAAAAGWSERALVCIGLSFAFAQTAHYVVWLRIVPELARARRAPRSFVRSYHALVAELGRPALVLGALLAVAFVVVACVDVDRSRVAYLRFALFHGPLEVGVLSIAAVESGAAWRR